MFAFRTASSATWGYAVNVDEVRQGADYRVRVCWLRAKAGMNAFIGFEEAGIALLQPSAVGGGDWNAPPTSTIEPIPASVAAQRYGKSTLTNVVAPPIVLTCIGRLEAIERGVKILDEPVDIPAIPVTFWPLAGLHPG